MNSIGLLVTVLVMASVSTAKIHTDVRASQNNNKVVSDDQISLFSSFINGNEVYLTKNNWFNFTIYTEEKDVNIGFKYLTPRATYNTITVRILKSQQEVLERSDPNIRWFLPPTTWYGIVEEGPVRESMNVNCFIPQAALMGIYHLKVSTPQEQHINITNLFVQETQFLPPRV